MFVVSLKRLSAAAAGLAAARLPSQASYADECPSNRKEFSTQRSTNFPLGNHWYGKLRVRVLKVRRDKGLQHSVSEYTVETRLYSDVYSRCFTEQDNTDVVSTDTQKNNVYVVAKRTAASSPEQFGIDIARHFLNEYPILTGVEINVQEQPWERVTTEGALHSHGFQRPSQAHAEANVKLSRNRRWEPEVTSSIKGMTVLKTTQSSWEKFLHDRYTTLADTDDRCMSTEISCDWTYVPKAGGAEPDFHAVRKQVQEQVTKGFFGPPKCGVHSASVQATVYDIGCMVLDSAPDVANITLNTPNLHYIPFMQLDKLGEKFEHDIYLPTSDPSGNIQCTVEREVSSDSLEGSQAAAFQPHAEAIKSDIRAALINMKSNACPMAMRVAWHSSGTYDRSSGTGGSDGATMRFEPEFTDGANAGLTMMIDMLKPVKDKNPDVSIADIWALAGAAGIEFLGGPKIPFAFGRTDSTGKERGCPAMVTPENGRLPDASQGAQHLRDVFGRQGFSDREIVALSGGHTLGRCHKVRSGYDGPWTDNPLQFDNSYFKHLMNLEWQKRDWDGKDQYEDVATQRLAMLPTDLALKTDPVFSKIAREYADNQEVFFRDFALAFSKLLHNGCANKPAELMNANNSVGATSTCKASCPVRAKATAPQNVSRQQAGLEFREYAMHGSTERMRAYKNIADVHGREANSGRTALHKAAFWGHIETITCLLDECKLDPNVQDFCGDTAMHDAVRFGHAPLVEKLLSAGADKKITNKDGKTAEELAQDYGKHDIRARLARR